MSKLLPFFIENQLEAGCDEAGRGCLSGPVVAAAVILPLDFYHPLLNDSKQLTEKKREILRPIIEKEAIAWAVSSIDHQKIDEINILNASILAMHEAVNALNITPAHLLIDGNKFHKHTIPHTCFVKGDGRFASIAAASVLAKTHRDEYMDILAEKYPQYNWKQNKGYPTLDHRKALAEFGNSPYHRNSFHLKNPIQLEMKFE